MACNEFPPYDVFTIVWRIENFSCITKWTNECVMTSDFKCQTLPETSLNLTITLNETVDKRGYLSLMLQNANLRDVDDFDCDCAFLDANETPIFTQIVKKCNFSKTADLVLTRGPTIEEIFTTKRSEYLPQDALTVRLRLWMSDEEIGEDDEYCFTRTVIGVDRSCNLWEIEEFSSLQVNEVLSKSIFFSYYGSCTLTFSFVGSSLESATLNLELTPDFQDYFISCKISVLDTDMKIFKSEQYKCVDSEPINFLNSFSRPDILNKKTQFLIEDTFSLLLECELFFYRDVETIYYRPANMKKCIPNTISEASSRTLLDKADQQQKNDSIIVLSEDFLSLYRNKTFCDFELHCGDANFPVHKLILSARSPVFRAMFSSHMLESDSNFQDVPDLDTDTLNRMLTFLYGGTLEPDLNAEDAAKLYFAGDKYQVQSLKEQCSFITKSRISTSNVCNVLLLADKHGFDELKSFAHEFLFAHLKETISSPAWKEFQDKNSELAASTMHLLLTRIVNN